MTAVKNFLLDNAETLEEDCYLLDFPNQLSQAIAREFSAQIEILVIFSCRVGAAFCNVLVIVMTLTRSGLLILGRSFHDNKKEDSEVQRVKRVCMVWI